MSRKRVALVVYVDLDDMPGTFHTVDSARMAVGAILDDRIPHYKPLVAVAPEDLDSDDNHHRIAEEARAAYRAAREETTTLPHVNLKNASQNTPYSVEIDWKSAPPQETIGNYLQTDVEVTLAALNHEGLNKA